VFTVTPGFVESPRFNTRAKRFAWSDVLSIAVETNRGVPVLLLLRHEQLRALAPRTWVTWAIVALNDGEAGRRAQAAARRRQARVWPPA